MSIPERGSGAGRCPAEAGSFELLHGASWLLPSGEVLVVPGFHEEWIAEHEELAAGARNVCELVLRRRWVSVALFSEGYLELMVPDRRSKDVRRMIWELLSRNAGRWSRALVMSMDEEGYAMIVPGDLEDEAAFGRSLSGDGRPPAPTSA
jgi:hypothetical protein